MAFADYFFAGCIGLLAIAALWRFTLAMWPRDLPETDNDED